MQLRIKWGNENGIERYLFSRAQVENCFEGQSNKIVDIAKVQLISKADYERCGRV